MYVEEAIEPDTACRRSSYIILVAVAPPASEVPDKCRIHSCRRRCSGASDVKTVGGVEFGVCTNCEQVLMQAICKDVVSVVVA